MYIPRRALSTVINFADIARRRANAVLHALPTARHSIAYGSGAIPQDGYTLADINAAQLDLLLVVDDAETWHQANMDSNPHHYSDTAMRMGPAGVAAFQHLGGGGLWFNPLVRGPYALYS